MATQKSINFTKRGVNSMRSIEKKLWNIGNDYRWGSLTNYQN